MSKEQIEIPDDRWFRGEWDFRPQDKQLCVIILKYDGYPRICQYLENDDAFIDSVDSLILGKTIADEWNLQMLKFDIHDVDRWKPLGLPSDVNERVLAEVEKWFEEDE